MEARLPDCLIQRASDPAWRPPLDEFDLAVRLETEGVTDEVARSVHGYAGTLAMAELCLPKLASTAPDSHAAPTERGWSEWLHGTLFAVPMILCALSMLTLGVSLWGGDLPADLASAVAVATVASLIVAGGFVQAMSRRALFYIGAQDFPAAAALVRVWGSAGVVALVATAFVGLAVNLVFAWMPLEIALRTAAFYMLLGLLWLGCGGLYLVDRAAWIGGATIAGIAVVAILHRALAWPLLSAQLAGVTMATVLSCGATYSWFRARVRRAAPESFLSAAREIVLAAPYFAYGALYYLFLFADRLIAWTAQTNAAALPLQFRGDYETALDLAMAAFVMQSGRVHASLAAFHREVEQVQRTLPAGSHALFNAALRRFYGWRVAQLTAFGVASSGAIYYLVSLLNLLPFSNVRPVLALALAAYPIVIVGLWNTSLLFALGKPGPVLASISFGASGSLAVGYLASRTGSYEAAVVGFLAGAFLFAALSSFSLLRSFQRLDGHYFASAL